MENYFLTKITNIKILNPNKKFRSLQGYEVITKDAPGAEDFMQLNINLLDQKEPKLDLENNENWRKNCVLEHKIPVNPELNYSDDDHPLLNYHGMMHIRNVGCGYTDKIILNGKFKGTVWNESFAGDGPIRIISGSFYKYICKTALINTED